jgi:hypothetical protein
MKRLITILISLTLAIALAGQSANKSRYVYNFAGGITVGGTYSTNDFNEKIDSIRVIGGTAYIYSGGDTIPVYTPVAGTIDNATVFVKLLADTTLDVTTVDTLSLNEAGRLVRYSNAAQTKVYVPTNATVAFPVGTVINIKMDGAGIVGILPCSGVTIQSAKDSCYINYRHGWATLIKRATNKWDLMGALTD